MMYVSQLNDCSRHAFLRSQWALTAPFTGRTFWIDVYVALAFFDNVDNYSPGYSMWLEGPYIYVFIKNTYVGALYCGNFYCLIIMLTTTDDGLKNQENDFRRYIGHWWKTTQQPFVSTMTRFYVSTTTTTTLFTTNSFTSLDNVSDKLICSRTRCTFRVNIRSSYVY